MTKKNICGQIRCYAIAHLQKEPITTGSEKVPDSRSFAYRRKHYHLFKQNITESNFW